jgi:hypothetical protein
VALSNVWTYQLVYGIFEYYLVHYGILCGTSGYCISLLASIWHCWPFYIAKMWIVDCLHQQECQHG